MSLPPSGEIPQGAIRFNTDTHKLEFYAQGEWWIMSTDTPNLASSGDVSVGPRGLFFGGSTPSNSDTIDYINISSPGNAVDFGNLESATDWPAACASSTRGIAAGGRTPSNIDTIQFVTIASTGNTTDFGNLTSAKREMGGCGNETRGLFGGETLGGSDDIEYVTIASEGNAVDFGNLIQA